ncbi:the ARF-like 2 binding protein BART-domain-containing protein [Haematococcus lacustris]
MEEPHWLAEAVVDFLRGPLYIHPLMTFIDAKCLCFTSDEENKFEYTTIHEEFKQLVDNLLTSFLEELGVTAETFYEVVAKEQDKDQLTSFVVQTILTVDDFLMFKAMMVKRNMDLTHQVLDAVEELRLAHEFDPNAPALTENELEEAMQLSQEDQEVLAKLQKLHDLMRSLQLQDEDVALALAIAESVKGITESQSEVAELEQALALSLSLEAEQQRLESSSSKGAAASGSGANAKTQELLHRPFPEPKPLELAHEPLLAAAANLEQVKAPALAPLPPLKVGPNTGAERLAAISTAAALAASGLSTPKPAVEAQASAEATPAPAAVAKNKPAPAPGTAPVFAGIASQPSIRNRAAGYKSGAAGSAGDVAAIREAAKQASNTQKALMAKMAGSGGQDAEQAQAWLQVWHDWEEHGLFEMGSVRHGRGLCVVCAHVHGTAPV